MKNGSEFEAFANALRKVVRVPKTEITSRLAAEKQVRKQRRKQPSVRASRAKD